MRPFPTSMRLPEPRHVDAVLMTHQGERHRFATVDALWTFARRRTDVVAVCLDNCAWREFGHFRDLVSQGLSAADAFDKTDFYVGQTSRLTPRAGRWRSAA